MALRGKPSTAHEYDKSNQCIHCGMYRSIVEEFTHMCTPQREIETDGMWMGKKATMRDRIVQFLGVNNG